MRVPPPQTSFQLRLGRRTNRRNEHDRRRLREATYRVRWAVQRAERASLRHEWEREQRVLNEGEVRGLPRSDLFIVHRLRIVGAPSCIARRQWPTCKIALISDRVYGTALATKILDGCQKASSAPVPVNFLTTFFCSACTNRRAKTGGFGDSNRTERTHLGHAEGGHSTDRTEARK